MTGGGAARYGTTSPNARRKPEAMVAAYPSNPRCERQVEGLPGMAQPLTEHEMQVMANERRMWLAHLHQTRYATERKTRMAHPHRMRCANERRMQLAHPHRTRHANERRAWLAHPHRTRHTNKRRMGHTPIERDMQPRGGRG